ncbi:MAG TPA: asparagine synthase (glutamine-hydrolyzing) [Rhizomicrobium sp.]
MCGIAGAYLGRGKDAAPALRAMCDAMIKRGPDAAGEWFDPEMGAGIGNRRLSIIDLDVRANQPLFSDDGRHVIVFNGEIYNYRVLRDELAREGVVFHTQGDTEVILELYRRRGVAAFAQLRGMFTIAVWDGRDKTIMLARDPYGIKPLYIGKTASGVVFASQVKAVQATGLVSKATDPAGVAGFHLWGSVPEPFTIYRDITALPAGSHVTISERGVSEPVVYADIAAALRVAQMQAPDLAERVRDAVAGSVAAHLVADVPIAVFLSGGIDSGSVSGLVAERHAGVEGVTISFDEFAGTAEDETPGARALADHYGIAHITRTVGKAEFLGDIDRILAAMDQPSIDGVNTWFASKAVAERGYKVVLSGIGGDELFGGYPTFDSVPKLYRLGRWLPRGRIASGLFGVLAKCLNTPKVAGIPQLAPSLRGSYFLRRGLHVPQELSALMPPDAAREGLARLGFADWLEGGKPAHGNLGAAISALESTQYLRNQLLRDSDWASMAHSLELRTPLVDWRLLQDLAPYSEQMIAGQRKKLLASSPRTPLPDSIVNRPKSGFGLPLDRWLQEAFPDSTPPGRPRQPWARRWARIVAKNFAVVA